MFTINENQFDAFAIPFAKKKRKQIMAELIEKRIGKVYEDGLNVIVEDNKGNKTIIQFDEEYVLSKVIKPSGIEYGFNYDEEGRLTRLLLPGQEIIEWVYYGDLLKGICFNDKITKFSYDEENRISAIVYPDKKTTSFKYNSAGQLDEMTNQEGGKRRFNSLIKNNCIVYKNTDELGRITEFESDGVGNIIKVIFPNGTTQQTVWDWNLQAERTILRNGSERIDYYGDRFATKVEYEDGGFINIDCNDSGRVNTLENESGILSYIYDDRGRKVSEAFQDKRTAYHYDEDDLLTEIIYPSGLKVSYLYDEDGRLKCIDLHNNKCEFMYGANDTLSEIHYPNGISERLKHRVIGGLEQIQVTTKWGEVICRQNYEYDALSRLTRYSNQDAFSPYRDLRIDYNEQGHIIECKDIVSAKTETYQYDAKGNMIERNGISMKIGCMDQIITLQNVPIKYDDAGNIVSFYDEAGNPLDLIFNDAGSLKYASTKNQKWEYRYDALGRRINKSDGKSTVTYYWNGDKLLTEEYTHDGLLHLREYIYMPCNSILVGFAENGNLYWLHKDVRGALCSITDNGGYVVWHAIYDSFGSATVTVNKLIQPWRLPGQYCDEETGLYYCYTRYYSPYLKFHLSLSPQWYNVQASHYSYGLNDPFNKLNAKGRISVQLRPCATIITAIINFCLAGPAGASIGELLTDRRPRMEERKKSLRWSEALKGLHADPLSETELLSVWTRPLLQGKTFVETLNIITKNH